jgi:hypothetical protein
MYKKLPGAAGRGSVAVVDQLQLVNGALDGVPHRVLALNGGAMDVQPGFRVLRFDPARVLDHDRWIAIRAAARAANTR